MYGGVDCNVCNINNDVGTEQGINLSQHSTPPPLPQYGRPFLALFLQQGMPVVDSCLRPHREKVCALLRTLQSATRVLQIVCTESKVRGS